MKKVEVVTPRGEVLWVGNKDHMSLAMHSAVYTFQLKVREILEPVEFDSEVRYWDHPDPNAFSCIVSKELNQLRGHKVRVRVEVLR